MDPVSLILTERERTRPRLFPFACIALFFHLAIVGSIFLMSRSASARPAQLPVVSVRIVQPEPAPRRRAPARPAARPTQAPPKATPEPVPTEPEPEATAPPVAEPPATRPSEDAMAAPEARSTPRPTPAPAEPAAGGGGGLSLGGGANAGDTSGIPSDFHFTYYVQRMLALIESRWYKPSVPEGTRARVRFTIARNGALSRIELESSSGFSSFDRAALRALYATNPLPPLPPAYRKQSLTVHLTFSE
ncbi:MAG TPA: energy transducer TonB [Candidatus Sulfomarinibacteraceae bacterium]|nr:energy transducer TonB [Candidatus Sulfomarinibacteraceae bacterium]